jgi:hypothetical protein
MKPQKANTNRTSKSRAQYICPGCGIGFCVDSVGGAYGLHPADFDDTFLITVCQRCGPLLHSDVTLRQKIRGKFEQVILRNDLNTKFAITAQKILTIHGHDLKIALEKGWPFSQPGHFYDVFDLPTGVFVFERESHSC